MVVLPAEVMKRVLVQIKQRIEKEFTASGLRCPEIKIDVDPTEKKDNGFGELQAQITTPQSIQEKRLVFAY